jgi:DNA-binding LacI/PurR family transcriptional regulator
VTYVGPLGRQVAEDRIQAFETEARRAGLDAAVASTGTAMDESSGSDAAATVLLGNKPPTAIVCYNDNVAFGVQNELVRRGIDDVAVTGFDNTYIAQLERISLTSIEQDVDEIVRRSCAVLTAEDSFEGDRFDDILIEPALAVRNSTSLISIRG